MYKIGSEILSIDSIREIINNDLKLSLSSKVKSQIRDCRKYLDKKITNSVYEFFPDGKNNNPPLGLLFLENFSGILIELLQLFNKTTNSKYLIMSIFLA